MYLIVRVNISVLPLAVQENGSYRIEAFCDTNVNVTKVLDEKQISCIC